MKAIILAAGRGSRMKDLTDERPKCLVELRGKTLLEWQLEALRGAGISEIAVVTGYKRELLARTDLREFHNSRWEETNMVSSLACASEWLDTSECIVSYSDIFYSTSVVRALMSANADLAITYDPNWLELWSRRFEDPLDDAETFRVGVNGLLQEIGNKPISLDEVQGQYMGLLKYRPAAWSEVSRIWRALDPATRDRTHMTGILQLVVDAGSPPILAVPISDEWGEIDSASDLDIYEQR